ncbi:MAG: hypothetical protein AB1758_07195 [Candidatus Eremiobacterota bacterium]
MALTPLPDPATRYRVPPPIFAELKQGSQRYYLRHISSGARRLVRPYRLLRRGWQVNAATDPEVRVYRPGGPPVGQVLTVDRKNRWTSLYTFTRQSWHEVRLHHERGVILQNRLLRQDPDALEPRLTNLLSQRRNER